MLRLHSNSAEMTRFLTILIILCFSLTASAQQHTAQIQRLYAQYDSLYALHQYEEAYHVLEQIMDVQREDHRVKMQKGTNQLNEQLNNEDLNRKRAAQEKELTMQHIRQSESDRLKAKLEADAARIEKNANDAKINNEQIRYENLNKKSEITKVRESAQTERSYKRAEQNAFFSKLSIIIAIAVLILMVIIIWWAYMIRKTNKRLTGIINQFKDMRNQANAANQMKNIFVQNMSHDIRTPLNAIMGFTQILSIPDLPLSNEEKKSYEHHIRNSANMLTMLIDDILSISDIENGNYAFTNATHKLNTIGRQALSCIEFRVSDAIKLYMTSDVDDDFTLFCDSRRVQQILINYLSNATKHTTEGEIHLHISTSEVPDMVTFSVTDTGTGIPAELADKIFERFTKLNDYKQGSGLGLNICRVLSEKMGGRVYLDTSYTNGARFKLDIPIKSAS